MTTKNCIACKLPFQQSKSNHIYCSKKCWTMLNREKWLIYDRIKRQRRKAFEDILNEQQTKMPADELIEIVKRKYGIE